MSGLPFCNSSYRTLIASITISPPSGISRFLVNLDIRSFLEIAKGSILASLVIRARFWPKSEDTSVLSMQAKVLTGASGQLNKFLLNFWNLERINFPKLGLNGGQIGVKLVSNGVKWRSNEGSYGGQIGVKYEQMGGGQMRVKWGFKLGVK